MRIRARLATVGIFGLLSFLVPFVAPVSAQEAQKPEAGKPEPNLTDDDLRKFAKVYVEVEKVRQDYEPRIKEAKDPEEVNRIQSEAVSRLEGALNKEGMTAENYNRIFSIARADEGLRQKLLGMIEEERQKS